MDAGTAWEMNILAWKATREWAATKPEPEVDIFEYRGSALSQLKPPRRCVMGDMFQVAKALYDSGKRVGFHVFADWKQWGGRVFMGANAQEEEAFRRSTLAHPGLDGLTQEVYPLKPGMVIIVHDVEFRDGFKADVFLCPAPFAVGNQSTLAEFELQCKALYVAVEYTRGGNLEVVTGAWGCGAFHGNAREIGPCMMRTPCAYPVTIVCRFDAHRKAFLGEI
jgi:hypothetical protein